MTLPLSRTIHPDTASDAGGGITPQLARDLRSLRDEHLLTND